MTLTTRKPNGTVPPPVVLLEGEEKAGKTYAALLLSASKRTGTTYVIDLGEGTADEYGAIPGADYLVVEHDGSYAAVLEAVLDVKEEAARAKAAGEPPVVLVLDSITDLWSGLKDWISGRAVQSKAGKRTLAADPNAEVKPTMNLWNDAAARHRKVMTALLTFPGIVVLTARGREVAEVKDGQPVAGARTWSVDAHKDVPFDATLWVRMRRSQRPEVIGARSVHPGIGKRPGHDDPEGIPDGHDDDLLEWLIFDVLKYDAAAADARRVQHLDGGALSDDERADDPDAPPREPVTDKRWLASFVQRVAEADRLPVLAGLKAEATGQHNAGRLHPKDGAMLRECVGERERALTAAAAQGEGEGTPEGSSEAQGATQPAERAPAKKAAPRKAQS